MRLFRGYAIAMIACASMTLASCAGMPGLGGSAAPPGSGTTTTEVIMKVGDVAAAIADAQGEAPPATLSKTSIDNKAIAIAFNAFDAALTTIDAWVASGAIVKNSPTAVKIKAGVVLTKRWLIAASAAQRTGDAKTYSAALSNAKLAIAGVQSALTQ